MKAILSRVPDMSLGVSRNSLFCLVLCAVATSTVASARQPATVTVYANDVLGPIDPLIFGYFTEETLGSFEGAIWSELLYNRKFGFEDRQPRVPIAQLGVSAGWQPLSLSADATLLLDRNEFLSPPYSQRITLTRKEAGPAGVAQSGLRRVLVQTDVSGRINHPFFVKTGEEYLVRLSIKPGDFKGPVYVALGKSPTEVVAEKSFQPRAADWDHYEATLTASADSVDAQFLIYIKDEGTVWVDSASLRLAKVTAKNGFRSDGLKLTSEVAKPTSLRWPGGCYADDYHWKDGIGPRDQRPDVFKRPWQDWCANDVGTDEFVALCRSLDAEPYICVNFGTGTPEEAAAWVEYCNGAPTTKWGRVRAANGHPDPYNVRYWNIGNETYLGTEFGGTNGTEYGRGYLRFLKAMRAVDPAIKLVSVGQIPAPQPLAQTLKSNRRRQELLRFWPEWPERFLALAANEIDQFSLHYYQPGNVRNAPTLDEVHRRALTIATDLSNQLDAIYAVKAQVAPDAPHFAIALDEWGEMMDSAPGNGNLQQNDLPAGVEIGEPLKRRGLDPITNLRQALGEAGVLNVVQRRPKDFGLGSKKILYAHIAGDIAFSRDAVVASPAAWMMGLYSTREPRHALRVETQSEEMQLAALSALRPALTAPYLDASARRSPDGKTIELFLVNRDWQNDRLVTIALRDVILAPAVEVTTLNGPDLFSINSFAKPEHVGWRDSKAPLVEGGLTCTVPAHALVRMTFTTN
ncbi:MAG: alpha-L-arabinofuranosidase C-terminal domain-containing protein [Planctomycetaceae bacterium]